LLDFFQRSELCKRVLRNCRLLCVASFLLMVPRWFLSCCRGRLCRESRRWLQCVWFVCVRVRAFEGRWLRMSEGVIWRELLNGSIVRSSRWSSGVGGSGGGRSSGPRLNRLTVVSNAEDGRV
jgi:uncharacterized membrane protein YgcG